MRTTRLARALTPLLLLAISCGDGKATEDMDAGADADTDADTDTDADADTDTDTDTDADAGIDGGADVIADAGLDAGFLATEILARPTAHAVTASAVPREDVQVFFEYGTVVGSYAAHTATALYAAGAPFATAIGGLDADTRYYYRMRWRTPESSAFAAGPERTFHTARAPGQPFVFAVQADPHLDDASNLELYRRTLANELADAPDFLVDLGDTFMCEKHSAPFSAVVETAPDDATVVARYLYERGNFGRVAHSAPLFLVNGNHEGEAGWFLDGTADNIAVWAALARESYFPPPQVGEFYSGTAVEEAFVGQRGAYYAFEWGDALFVVLDPYWYTTVKNKSDGWVWTLGEAQYQWLADTLAGSDAAFRFVFIHNLVGGLDAQGRGGVEAAPYYEWGGASEDAPDAGTAPFTAERPGWAAPIHELLVDNHVSAVFHGHDHVYVRQELDGIVYLELAQPSSANFNGGTNLAAEGHYESGVIASSSGHLRVSVSSDEALVEYVRAYRASDENASRHNGDVADSFTLVPR